MSKVFAFGALLLFSVACGSAAPPTLAPTATIPPTPIPTLTPTVEPTATPSPTPTLTPEPTATPPITEEPEPAADADDHHTSVLNVVFPEIASQMKDIRPVYIAYFHSDNWHAPGKNTTVDEVFKLLKMDNIVTHEGHQQINPAMVVDLEPDLIIADSIESVVENPDLAGLHMVQDTEHIPHHIFVMREGYSFNVSEPGFRDTVKAFAAFAYPDTFTVEEAAVDGHVAGHEETGDEASEQESAREEEESGHEESGHGDGHGHSHSHGH